MAGRFGLEIRAAVAADAAGLCELLAGSGLAATPRAMAARIEALGLGPGAALIAAEWGPPSGVIVLHWHGTLHTDLAMADVSLLLVGPENRRRGVGRLLLKAAAQAARVAGCGSLSLTARPDQPALSDFCRATGFTEAGTAFVRPLRKKG